MCLHVGPSRTSNFNYAFWNFSWKKTIQRWKVDGQSEMRLVQHRAKVENIASKFEGVEENLRVFKDYKRVFRGLWRKLLWCFKEFCFAIFFAVQSSQLPGQKGAQGARYYSPLLDLTLSNSYKNKSMFINLPCPWLTPPPPPNSSNPYSPYIWETIAIM